MAYSEAAWERAMKVQEVIMKALTGELHWYRPADILGFSRGPYAGGVSGTRPMAMTACWISGVGHRHRNASV
jgi:hypothetical protein